MTRATCLTIVITAFWASTAFAQSPTVEQALSLKPTQLRQMEIEYSIPTEDECSDCTVESAEEVNQAGWLVYDGRKRLLRKFIDSNRDKNIDQWSYFKDGVEVYRDIDTDFDGAVDECRWLGTSGTKWGIDNNQDEKIDAWKQISAEEISYEVVQAIRDRDFARFSLLLPSDAELASLGQGEQLTDEIKNRIENAKKEFANMVARQKTVTTASQWVQFSGTQPGTIPAGSDGSTKDLVVYDNAAAVIDTDGTHGQVAIGSIIKIDNSWRMVDLPQPIVPGEPLATGGLFFQLQPNINSGAGVPAISVSSTNQALFSDFEKVEQALRKATSRQEKIKLNEQRITIIAKIVSASKGKEQSNWIRQYADTVTGAFQTQELPDGMKYLAEFVRRLKANEVDQNDVGYVAYRMINAQFTHDLGSAGSDQDEVNKVQKQFVKDLDAFVKEFPNCELSADAMLQLALSAEFSDGDSDAKDWYNQIVRRFAKLPVAEKARGALVRLNSEGKSISIKGNTLNNQAFNVSSIRGKVVIIHYWATWCEPCKEDIKTLQTLYRTYGGKGLEIVGLNLDEKRDDVTRYLQTNRLPWIHLHEPGGLESPLAEQLGIVTLPTMLMIGKDGRVVDRNITASELDRAIKREIK